MPMLPDQIKQQVQEAFAGLKNPVQLIVFTQTLECAYCRENRQLIEEVASLSDQVNVQVYDFVTDKDQVDKYQIDRIPALAIVGDKDYGIRFYGIPAGYEFTTLIHTIRMVGGGGSQLDENIQEQVKALPDPVHLQVFVTPTCPYCPTSVVVAFEMAYVSDQVRADGVESSEFPQLAVKYQVAGVPRTIINEKTDIEGAAPPDMVLDKIKEALVTAAETKE
jgi:glutaredoxin-like protein